MTTNDSFSEDKIKSFDSGRRYVYCDICEFNGYPNQEVVYDYEGQRSEDEDGFIIRFAVYDYPIQAGKLHVHKYIETLIYGLVNVALGNVRRSSNGR